MREVGAFEAKNKLGQLLDLVEQGEEVITPAMARRSRSWCRFEPPEAASKPTPRCGESASAPSNVSLANSTGPNGSLTGMKVAHETCARRLGDACLYLQRRDHRAEPPRLDAVANEGAMVPALWRLEVRQQSDGGRAARSHRRRLSPCRSVDLALGRHDEPDRRRRRRNAEHGDRLQLTVCDAAYPELAHRRTLPLATLDSELRTAAQALGLRVIGTD